MIHGQKTKQLGRERNARNALLKTLAVSLIRDLKIKTTETKAKVLKPIVEKLVTKAKAGDMAGKRFIEAKVGPVSAKKMVDSIAPKYKDRKYCNKANQFPGASFQDEIYLKLLSFEVELTAAEFCTFLCQSCAKLN